MIINWCFFGTVDCSCACFLIDSAQFGAKSIGEVYLQFMFGFDQ